MSRRLYEWKCAEGHKFEALERSDVTVIPCRECGSEANRLISAVRCKLEGITGDFPSAYDAWTRMHKPDPKKQAESNEEQASLTVVD